MDRRIYEAPQVTVLGAVAELTAGKGSGAPDTASTDGGSTQELKGTAN